MIEELKEELVDYDTAFSAKAKGFNFGVNNSFRKALFKGKNPDWEGVFAKGTVFADFGKYHSNNHKAADGSNKKWAIYARPSQSLLRRWLRDRRTDITIITDWEKEGRTYTAALSHVNSSNEVDIWISKRKGLAIKYATYEEALDVALLHALSLLPEAS